MSLAFVIPTRNRPELAIAAVRSLLAQHATPMTVVVSDNSSREEDVRQLRDFCDAAADPRLLYIRPPEVMMMSAHWNWALEQALVRTAATHFGIHYDRKVSKAGSVEQLAGACARYEETVVSFPCDFAYASGGEFAGWQFPATGKDFEIRTARVVELTARGALNAMGQAWPILMNCMVPRAILERVRTRFGTICESATPDTAFAYRFCALAGRYVFLDRALGVMYAYRFSNGLSYLRRERSGAFEDYMKLWGDRPWVEAAPIPGIDLGLNVIFHEYNLVRREIGEQLLPPIQWDGYLRELALGLQYLADPREQSEWRGILEKHGWRPDPPPRKPALWRRAWGRLRRPRVAPVDANPRFATEAEAVDYLVTHTRPVAARNALLDILEPVEIGTSR